MLRTGARWRDLPAQHPSPATCWRRLAEWERQDVWRTLWRAILSALDARGQLDWSEAFLDATFAPAKEGAPASASHAKVRGRSVWYWSTARVFLSACTFRLPTSPRSGSPKPRWRRSRSRARGRAAPPQKPARVIADQAYDSHDLWARLRARGIDLIAPHRRSRRTRFQDGRKLRRYHRRWIIERTNAWLLSFRRLTVRYEHRLEIDHAFVLLACILITLRRL